jgi:hypothetical protein
LADLNSIWATGTDAQIGSTRSVETALFKASTLVVNQALALDAATNHGIDILTIGNTSDWLYSPCLIGINRFNSTQNLQDAGATSGLFSRTIASTTGGCTTALDIIRNHGVVLTDSYAELAIRKFTWGFAPPPVP